MTEPQANPAGKPHVTPTREYVTIGVVLLVLLGVTLAVAAAGWGVTGVVIGLAIAVTKAVLVAVFFMHLNTATPLTRLFAAAGCFWLAILIALTLNDFLTRS